ncbi:MAG: delta-lactam-biosynthetic de-N-acetylase [Ruminococcaceae bacterium]|nr:delta-lactam-biosynthetic de-N-acetylase [Oscillospiraceae bacterium]
MPTIYKKSITTLILCILTILTANPCHIHAENPSANAQGWYFRKTTDHTQPTIAPELSYVQDHNGWWIDRRHCDINSEDKVIYLTFDAGYENGNIEKILDILKSEEVPAAFFVLKNLVQKDTALVKRMKEEGHLICNHTANHKDMTKLTDFNAFKAEIEEMEKIYTENTGEKLAPYYRPPEGKTSEQTMKWTNDLGYKTIFWSFAYADWDNNNQMSPEKAIEKVLAGTHNGEVLLLHPTSATNAEILDDLIREWKNMGFRFGTLDELTGERDM